MTLTQIFIVRYLKLCTNLTSHSSTHKKKKHLKAQDDSKRRRLQPSTTNTTRKYKYVYYCIPIAGQYQNISI
jgi:hypothetical protein